MLHEAVHYVRPTDVVNPRLIHPSPAARVTQVNEFRTTPWIGLGDTVRNGYLHVPTMLVISRSGMRRGNLLNFVAT